MMMRIGAHVSIKGGLEKAPSAALRIGAKAFALFTRNQRQWAAKALQIESISRFKQACRESGYSSRYIVPHAPYLINLGSPEPEVRKKSFSAFREELARCRQLGLEYLVFHPGSHR